jgi:hypothetical protein
MASMTPAALPESRSADHIPGAERDGAALLPAASSIVPLWKARSLFGIDPNLKPGPSGPGFFFSSRPWIVELEHFPAKWIRFAVENAFKQRRIFSLARFPTRAIAREITKVPANRR